MRDDEPQKTKTKKKSVRGPRDAASRRVLRRRLGGGVHDRKRGARPARGRAARATAGLIRTVTTHDLLRASPSPWGVGRVGGTQGPRPNRHVALVIYYFDIFVSFDFCPQRVDA